MWKTRDGEANPLATIASTIGGVRSLKYSPLGSGKRVLLASEPADIVSVIDAETYESKQTLDMFGEIAGTDFSPDGQSIYVGVHDNLRGGLMEFEKCGFGRSYEHESIFRRRDREVDMYDSEEADESMADMSAGLDWKRSMADVIADPKSKRTATHRRRRAARMGDIEPY
jgi:DNA-binding beta-propeller fold protein YncE